MSDGSKPKNWWEAGDNFAWGGLFFTCAFVFIEKLVEQAYGQALASLLLGLGVAAVAIHSKEWIERTNPNLIYAAFALLLCVIVFSPFVEEKRWPFSMWFQSTPMVVHDSPSTDDIAKAIAPIKAELEAAKQRGANLKSQLDSVLKARDLARSNPSFYEGYTLSENDIRNLRDAVFDIRNLLPPHISISTADDGAARRVANALAKGIGLGGVSTDGMSVGYPVTPQETGISIRVEDLKNIPDGAKKLGNAIKNVTNVEPKYTTFGAPGIDGFSLFVGTDPKEK